MLMDQMDDYLYTSLPADESFFGNFYFYDTLGLIDGSMAYVVFVNATA